MFRGLNNPAKMESVKQVINTHRPLIVCLQETKLSDITQATVTRCLGADYANNFNFLAADGTRGVLLACKDRGYHFADVIRLGYTVSATVNDIRTGSQWTITGVYGPQDDMDKRLFLQELRSLKSLVKLAWLILGDFNMIYLTKTKTMAV
jgi:exonuclease III